LVIRSTTRLVQVSVIAKDKNGLNVMGLTRNDFTVLDGGKEQKIQLFAVETNTPPSEKNAAKLPPGTLSNRPAGTSGVPRNLTVVLLDSYNTAVTDSVQARKAILRFLEQIQPTDHVAIYALGTKLTVLQDFTNDSKLLVEALKKYKLGMSGVGAENAAEPPIASGGAGDPFAATVAALNQGITDITGTIANAMGNVRAQQSLRALETVAGTLSGVPGRKNLIWVCGDFPLRIAYAEAGLDPKFRDLKEDMDHAARAINSSNIAVYPLDAAGLLGVPEMGASAFSTDGASRNPGAGVRRGPPNTGPEGGDGLAERIGGAATNRAMTIHSAMNDLADRTGGRAFYNTNDLFTAIRQVADDSQMTYMVSYAPDHNKWTGEFREIKIKVNRPGVQLMARRGYLALPDLVSDDQMRRTALGQAAASPVTSSGLKLTIRPVRQQDMMVMNMELDVHEISFEQKNGKFEALVDLFFVMKNAAGAVVDQVHQPADLSLSPEDYHKLEATGIGLSLPVPISKGTAKVRVVARDSASGQVGSLDVPVTP